MQSCKLILTWVVLSFVLILSSCKNDDEIKEEEIIPGPTTTEIEQANVGLVENFYNTLINNRDSVALISLMATDFFDNDAMPGHVQTNQGKISQMMGFFGTFPNATVNTENDQQYIPMGKYVAVYSDFNWSIDGPVFFGITPTGQSITMSAFDIWEIENNQLQQVWHTEDFLGVLAFQLVKQFCGGGTPFYFNRTATTNFPTSTGQVPNPNYNELSDTEKDNLTLVKKHYNDMLVAGDFAEARTNLSDNFVDHNAFPGEVGPDDELTFIQGVFMSFPDFAVSDPSHQWFIVKDNLVISHMVIDMPYNGAQPFMGIPVSNTNVSFVATDMWKVENGKIVELWHVENMVDVAFQAGGVICP